uniref:asparagine synthase-related protein n=1 Tax=uncultured Oscillibacter sp. TaxID=876091 RepID=UPI0026283F08
MNQTTAAAMSGGVDSTAAALLLLEGGHRVEGVTLRLAPCGQDGTEDARAAARALNIPHHLFDLTGLFQEKVVSPFVQAYETGRTPNPCVLCNREIKFGALLELAREWGWDKVATGHYARLDLDAGSGRWLLKEAARPDKDQSYELAMLTQEQLARALFPLGE